MRQKSGLIILKNLDIMGVGEIEPCRYWQVQGRQVESKLCCFVPDCMPTWACFSIPQRCIRPREASLDATEKTRHLCGGWALILSGVCAPVRIAEEQPMTLSGGSTDLIGIGRDKTVASFLDIFLAVRRRLWLSRHKKVLPKRMP
jgi:hypothetical protein